MVHFEDVLKRALLVNLLQPMSLLTETLSLRCRGQLSKKHICAFLMI